MNKIKTHIVILFGVFAVVLFAGVYFVGKKEATLDQPLWTASGLNPGDEVSFVATKQDGTKIPGRIAADEQGVVALPQDYFSSGEQNFLSYALQVEEQDLAPLSVLIDLDQETGRVSVSGSGLDQYADISLERGDEILQTKADWAGVFESLNMNPPKKWETPKEKILRLSLKGQSWIPDPVQDNAKERAIEIQFFSPAGKGGGATSDGVNSTSVSGCGSPPLSICDTKTVRKAMDDLVANYVGALRLMTDQLSAVAMQQTMIIGTFFDAEQQMEAQRDFQAMESQAQKDYYPSDQMCRFGSFTRSIAHSEFKADHDKLAINEYLMTRYLNKEDTAASEGADTDFQTQIEQYKNVYCDPVDNGGALADFCREDNDNPDRLNKDIDFTRTVASNLTLNSDFRRTGDDNEEQEEADILALARNLYSPIVLEPPSNDEVLNESENYMDVRRLAAFQNIAHSSYASNIAMRSKAPDGLEENSGGAFMKTFLRDLDMLDPEIIALMGDEPSYYAQMDVLTKKIYQDPNFYTNLYDKPVNVDRIGVSMRAISLMNARDQYESALRKEMLLSMLVEEALADRTESAAAAMYNALAKQ